MLARYCFSLVLLIAPLATGCCCAQLSGRFCDAGAAYFPPDDRQSCDPSGGCHHCGYLSHLAAFLGIGGAGVPSEQGPDYISPQPKFHRVPTHPVFELQLAAPPPQLIETADSNPPRAAYSPYGHQPARLPQPR